MTAHPTFTPSAITPDALDAITVGRDALFETLVSRISSAVRSGSRPHTLLVAPRGGGKTHTLHVAVHRSLAEPEIAEHVLPVMIPEDALAIGSYLDLLVEIARAIDGEVGETARALRRDKDAVGIEQAITDAAAGRMILLAIENLDRVFDSLGSTGQGSLRAWVETSTDVMIFATAPMLFSGVASRSYPWYGSFMVETLLELSVEEGAVMLRLAAQRRGDEDLASFVNSPEGLDRLQVVHRLAGGSPRLWHILSDCVDVNSLDALVPAVEALLDRLAPYYQQRLWQLPTGEQRLVVELARGWEPQTVSDLAAAVGVSNQSASAALGRLAADRWVVATKTTTGDRRSSWYDLTEPLLRYQLQYREDRGKPLRLIVEFLRSFYSNERLIAELAEAQPGSPVERHLQQALLEGDWLSTPRPSREVSDLIGGLRLWIAENKPGIVDVAIAMEQVTCAAFDRECIRSVPANLRPIVSQAIDVAQADNESSNRRFLAGLDVLSTYPWDPAGGDALLWVEIAWGATETERRQQRLANVLQSTRINEPAILLKTKWARDLIKSDEPDSSDRALIVLNELLDDTIDQPDHQATLPGLWVSWTQAAVHSRHVHPRRAPEPLAAAVGVIQAITGGTATWRDLAKIMESISADNRGQVAAHIALLARRRGVDVPPENDPLEHVETEVRTAIRRIIDEES